MVVKPEACGKCFEGSIVVTNGNVLDLGMCPIIVDGTTFQSLEQTALAAGGWVRQKVEEAFISADDTNSTEGKVL